MATRINKNHTNEIKEKISKSMLNNNNAEVWTIEESRQLFNEALKLSYDEKYDFIGEIARDLKSYIDVFDYLTDKYPELKKIKNQIMRNCEANCFSNSKKGKIREATAIVNLKSHHGWTDRTKTELTGAGGKDLIPKKIEFVNFDNE